MKYNYDNIWVHVKSRAIDHYISPFDLINESSLNPTEIGIEYRNHDEHT